jgi:hypothetical protein
LGSSPMSTSGETAKKCRNARPAGAARFKPLRARADAFWFLGAGGLALAFLRFYPFSSNAPFPVCGFRWLTGHPCPLCGMTRALSCLTKGDWASAVHLNLLSPMVFGLLLVTIGSVAVQFFSPEFSFAADLGLKCEKWWTACLALFAIYGFLRIVYLVP